jgi:hypothetical protein
MLKPKSNQSSGYTHTFTQQAEKVKQMLSARKLMATVFLDRK